MRLAITFLFFSCIALATEKSHAIFLSEYGVTSASLGSTCAVFPIASDALFCSPIWIATEKNDKPGFKGNFFFGNDISNTGETMRLASGNASAADVKSIFSTHQNSYLSSNLELGYTASTWAFSYIPARVIYYSQFNNEALPELHLFASVEKEARAQMASYVQNDVFLGLQLRYINRKFISGQFFLTDVLAENGNSLLESKNQDNVFLEPSIAYIPDGNDWTPSVVASVENLGWISKNYNEFPSSPKLNLGSSIVLFQQGKQKLAAGINAGYDRDSRDIISPLGIGSIYQYGALRLSGSLHEYRSSAGFIVVYKNVETGLVYVNQTVDSNGFKNLKVQNVYMTLGATL